MAPRLEARLALRAPTSGMDTKGPIVVPRPPPLKGDDASSLSFDDLCFGVF